MEGASQLEQFVLLAKGTRGRAAADLVLKATSAPGVFVFAELLDVASVQELQKTEQVAAYVMLQLFAYGTLPQLSSVGQGVKLTEQQTTKLRQLTVVSLAGQTKMISYAVLMQQLSLANIRQLEDFVINECFYAGIIRGKLDQQKQCLHVHDAISRDVPREDLGQILEGLDRWHKQACNALSMLDDRIQWTHTETANAERVKAAVDVRIEELKKGVKGAAGESSEVIAIDAEPGVVELMEHDRSTGARSKRRR